ncbi:MAG: hypothetical protein JWO36_5265 [Myxococcales bacterium]|nr:hypothetical protein [Myxococcales bacterium]
MCLVTITGCVKTTTYGYQYRMEQQFGGTEEPEPPPVEARQLLANARTVAFYPPDVCVNTERQSDRGSAVIARCGALLSKLERDAERAGFEVVSWVNLRGQKRPIEYAREANVDVLFEINELLPQQINDVDVQRKLTFFNRPQDKPDEQLQVSATVAERCHQWAKRDKPITAGLTSTLDIKTVSVQDGRARWHYRKSVSQSSGEDFPKVRFVGATTPNKGGNVLAGVGGGTLLAGIVFAVVDSSNADMINSATGMPNGKVFGDAPTYMIVGGALALAAGIAILVGTGQSQPDPDSVLCLEDHVPTNGSVESATGVQGPLSSEHTFNETKVSDPLAKEEERLGVDRANEFFAILTEIRTSHPRAAPAAPPAGAAPAAAPTAAPVPVPAPLPAPKKP